VETTLSLLHLVNPNQTNKTGLVLFGGMNERRMLSNPTQIIFQIILHFSSEFLGPSWHPFVGMTQVDNGFNSQ
jgi:Na+-transporting methylmalonyl-CoA/oxaloacetate decarboxylase beta subunit